MFESGPVESAKRVKFFIPKLWAMLWYMLAAGLDP